MVTVVMPRRPDKGPRENQRPAKETHFEVSTDTLTQLVFEQLLTAGKLPHKRHSIELRFQAETVRDQTRITGATFIARELE